MIDATHAIVQARIAIDIVAKANGSPIMWPILNDDPPCRLRPLPSIELFILTLRSDGECKLPYDGIDSGRTGQSSNAERLQNRD